MCCWCAARSPKRPTRAAATSSIARLRCRTPRRGEAVNHPAHYGGEDNPYEAIKVIEAWELPFNTGNTVKYISRAGKKDPAKHLEDLRKARWYLDREISNMEKVNVSYSCTLAEED
jgi:hypothetical protein